MFPEHGRQALIGENMGSQCTNVFQDNVDDYATSDCSSVYHYTTSD